VPAGRSLGTERNGISHVWSVRGLIPRIEEAPLLIFDRNDRQDLRSRDFHAARDTC
jgi:hypothetical protein